MVAHTSYIHRNWTYSVMSSWSAESKACSWEKICHFWQEGGLAQSDLLSLMPINVFRILNTITWVDAYNFQTGSNFLQELGILFWAWRTWWWVHRVSNKSCHTFVWPENQYYMAPSLQCLHPLDNAALCCLRLTAFYSSWDWSSSMSEAATQSSCCPITFILHKWHCGLPFR